MAIKVAWVPPGALQLAAQKYRIMSPETMSAAIRKLDSAAIVEFLNKGGSIHDPGNSGESVFAEACSLSDDKGLPLLAFFISQGAELQKHAYRAAKLALTNNNIQCFDFIMSRIPLNLQDAHGETFVFKACRDGDIAFLDRLLKRKESLDLVDEENRTLLHMAAKQGHTIVLKTLINHAPQLKNQVDKKGNTALCYAAEGGNLEALEYLLSLGESITHKNVQKNSPLLLAIRSKNEQCTMFLLGRLTPSEILEEVDSEGNTPLLLAVQFSSQTVVQKLLYLGASLLEQNRYQKNVMHLASNANIPFLLSRPVSNKLLDSPDSEGNLPGMTGFDKMNLIYHVVETNPALLFKPDNHGILLWEKLKQTNNHLTVFSKLSVQLKYSDVVPKAILVDILLEKAPFLTTENISDIISALTAREAIIELFINRLLLESDFNSVYRILSQFKEPLLSKVVAQIACTSNIEKRLYVSWDSTRDLQGNFLHYVCEQYRNNGDFANKLIDKLSQYPEFHCKSSSQKFPWEFLIRDEEYYSVSKKMKQKDHLQSLGYLVSNVPVNHQDDSGETLLFKACKQNQVEFFEELLDKKADCLITNNAGQTLVHVAAQKGHQEILQKLQSNAPELIKNEDKKGNTALFYAAEAGHLESMVFLSKAGESLLHKNTNKSTVLHLAIRHKKEDCTSFILQETKAQLVSEVDADGNTPMLLAAQFSSIETVEKLHTLGGSFLDTNLQGKNIFHLASKEIMVHLLKYPECGQLLTLADKEGKTPLMSIAAEKPALIEYIVNTDSSLLFKTDSNGVSIWSACKEANKHLPIFLKLPAAIKYGPLFSTEDLVDLLFLLVESISDNSIDEIIKILTAREELIEPFIQEFLIKSDFEKLFKLLEKAPETLANKLYPKISSVCKDDKNYFYNNVAGNFLHYACHSYKYFPSTAGKIIKQLWRKPEFNCKNKDNVYPWQYLVVTIDPILMPNTLRLIAHLIQVDTNAFASLYSKLSVFMGYLSIENQKIFTKELLGNGISVNTLFCSSVFINQINYLLSLPGTIAQLNEESWLKYRYNYGSFKNILLDTIKRNNEKDALVIISHFNAEDFCSCDINEKTTVLNYFLLDEKIKAAAIKFLKKIDKSSMRYLDKEDLQKHSLAQLVNNN